MKNALIKFAFVTSMVLFIAQCTKVAEDNNNVHPEGWALENSENFHGIKVKSSGTSSCTTCHGEDSSGGSLGISCYGCHAGGPSGHPADSLWVGQTGSDEFHGNSVADFGPSPCSSCHGTDYTGGLSGQSCFECHAGGPSGHPADSLWYENSDSEQFHGLIVASSGPQVCSDCHGTDYTGGTSEQSCFTCHAGGQSGHPATSVWVEDPSNANFHGAVVAANTSEDCKTCHGDDYLGGTSGQSCFTCHAGGASGHPATSIWVGDPDNANFHGKAVAANGPSDCTSCHGNDYLGGTSGQSCFTCHAGGASGHPATSIWVGDPDNAEFHGNSVAETGPTACATCHGNDYLGGTSEQSCFTCHAGGPSGHPATSEWVGNPGGSDFHGLPVAQNGPSDCATCHGDDYLGGTSGQSCFTCHGGGPSGHPASSEWLVQTSEDYHGKVLWDNGWDFSDCQTCHGSNLDGGTSETNCGTCHTQTTTELFTCYTCHGDSQTEQFNPPDGIMGENLTTDLSVGAHEAHLDGGTYSTVIACNECHNVPDSWDADGHLGEDNRAEINFGTLATGNGTVTPSYNSETGTCSNVYCHGNFEYGTVTGNNATMVWTSSDGAPCGSCHNLAPTGHFGSYTEATQCNACHPAVVDTDGNISNKSLHINGAKNTSN